MGHSVEEFFDTLLEDSNGGQKLPNWWVYKYFPRVIGLRIMSLTRSQEG